MLLSKEHGLNLAVTAGIVVAIGDINRFSSLQKLVSCFGLNSRVRQSGLGAAHHGRMLVEAAWAAVKMPGPLHAFIVRIRDLLRQKRTKIEGVAQVPTSFALRPVVYKPHFFSAKVKCSIIIDSRNH